MRHGRHSSSVARWPAKLLGLATKSMSSRAVYRNFVKYWRCHITLPFLKKRSRKLIRLFLLLKYSTALSCSFLGHKVGDRVVALPEFGALSEYVTCRASVCFKMAADMSWHEAIALATNGITAYSLLFELGTLHPGKSILLHPAPGGLVNDCVQERYPFSAW